MATMPPDDLARLLMSAPKGPEDLIVDWALANRTHQEARVALQRARIKNPDVDVATLKAAITSTREAAQKARLAYMEAARVTPLEAAENLDQWLQREGRLEKDMRLLEAQIREA